MADSTWHRFFRPLHGPIKEIKISKERSNPLADFNRQFDHISVNGKPLKDALKEYRNSATEVDKFEDLEELKDFFYKVILNNNKIREEESKIFFSESFHQGGILFPASSSITSVFRNKEKDIAYMLMGSDQADVEKRINIVTTKKGFKLQEFYLAKKAFINEDAPNILFENAAKEDGVTIKPDNPELEDYVIKAEVSIELDFTNSSRDPKLSITSNHISYGNDAVKKCADKRNFLQVVIDFFVNLLGINVVRELSVEKRPPKQTEPRP